MREMTERQFRAAMAKRGFRGAGDLWGIYWLHDDAPGVHIPGIIYTDGRIAYRATLARVLQVLDGERKGRHEAERGEVK